MTITSSALALSLLGSALAPSPPQSAEQENPAHWPALSETIVIMGTMVGSHRHRLAPPDVPQMATAKLNDCSKFVAAGMSVAPPPGATLFWYRVASDGRVRNASLYRSSGNASFDSAAIACADLARASPTRSGRVSAKIAWIGAVDWAWSPDISLDPDPDGRPRACRTVPPILARLREHGTVIIGLHVGADGTPEDETVIQGSGHALDDASLQCVASFRYFPPYENGQPIVVDKVVRLVWQFAF